MADWNRIGRALGGFAAGWGGTGPQYVAALQRGDLLREQEKEAARRRMIEQEQARGNRTNNLALTIRAAGEQLNSGNIDRAVTLLNETLVGSQGTPMANLPAQLKQAIVAAEGMVSSGDPIRAQHGMQMMDQVKQQFMALDKEFTTRFGLPTPKEAEPFTLGPGDVRFSGDGREIARGPEGEAGMREDQNGILRYTTGPNQGKPVFPDVVTNLQSLSNKDYDAMASGFRDEIHRANGDFYKLQSSWDRIAAGVDGPSPVGDLALVYNFMKMLDPGSTVMQGEIASAQNTTGTAGRLYGIYNKIISGEDLLPEQRADFYQQAQAIYNESKARAGQIEQQIAAMAQRRGLNIEDIIIDRGPDPDVSSALPGGGASGWGSLPVVNTQQEYDALPVGSEYIEILRDGRRVRGVKE